MLLTVPLIIPILVFILTIFLPRGRIFEAAMADARAKGIVTPGPPAPAWRDPAVAFARRYEVAAIAIIIALMVLRPTFWTPMPRSPTQPLPGALTRGRRRRCRYRSRPPYVMSEMIAVEPAVAERPRDG